MSDKLLYLFTYGTLKKGHCNHNYYCQDYKSVHSAIVRGQLYESSSGIPALIVPEDDILALGTANYAEDMVVLYRMQHALEAKENRLPQESEERPVFHGEVYTFSDPVERLASLDKLEEFEPGGPSFFQRVLVPVYYPDGKRSAAWIYVLEKPRLGFYPVKANRWPSFESSKDKSESSS